MELPCRIGKYELQEFLGGGMSHVYRATDTVIGRTVAIKILTEQGCADQDARNRFLQEARTAGRVSHENILAVYDFGEDQGKPFIVMEFLRGEDLRKAIQNGRTGDTKNKLRIALQIARALEFIHEHHITHRDIKPENVYINAAGNAKLMDFGIAKSEGAQITRAGFVLGTPYYMSPEQVQGRDVTPLVDVYAFGVLLFELFAGVKPIQGDSIERIFYAILHEPLDMSPLERAGAPEDIRRLISCATSKDPAERYQNFGEICTAIEKIIRGERIEPACHNTQTLVIPDAPDLKAARAAAPQPIPSPAPEPPPAVRTPSIAAVPKWAGAAAAGVIVIGAVMGWMLLRNRPHTPEEQPAAAPTALPQTIETEAGDMVLVPAGAFLFGRDKTKTELPAYYVDRTEVSNGAYAKFCNATGHALPAAFNSDRPELPVVNVTFDDARQFAQWAGKRIPDAKEWEKAARGADGRTYPWGDAPSTAMANVGTGALVPVSAFENGRSPCGALQMSGNVWELIDTSISPSARAVQNFTQLLKHPVAAGERWIQVRGASADTRNAIEDAVIYDGASTPASYSSAWIGFRCVRDARK